MTTKTKEIPLTALIKAIHGDDADALEWERDKVEATLNAALKGLDTLHLQDVTFYNVNHIRIATGIHASKDGNAAMLTLYLEREGRFFDTETFAMLDYDLESLTAPPVVAVRVKQDDFIKNKARLDLISQED